MPTRLRLLQAATALLYLGPLLAGLSGQGWAMVPLFAAIFVLWSVILRPHLWPASFSDLGRTEAIMPAASLVATQILLVAVCFALGIGIAGVMGLHLTLPVYLSAALSFLSVPLSRLIWNPEQVETLAGFDPLLHRPGPAASNPAALARSLVAEVRSQPEDIGEADLQTRLDAIATHVDAVLIRRALADAAHSSPTSVGLKALIVHATDPDVAELLSGSAYPTEAFALASNKDDLLTLFATRCARAVEDDPLIAPDCPPPATLRKSAQSAGPEARTALLRLAGLLTESHAPDTPVP